MLQHNRTHFIQRENSHTHSTLRIAAEKIIHPHPHLNWILFKFDYLIPRLTNIKHLILDISLDFNLVIFVFMVWWRLFWLLLFTRCPNTLFPTNLMRQKHNKSLVRQIKISMCKCENTQIDMSTASNPLSVFSYVQCTR